MIYEIGWSAYDIRYIVIMLFFIPLLIAFILFQNRYNTAGDDVDNGILTNNARGSKSHTKFMVSFLLIFLMLVSLSPIMTLYSKGEAMNCYKNGEYETFTGIAMHHAINKVSFSNEENQNSYYFDTEYPSEVKNILLNDIKNYETYTIYFTYSVSEKTARHRPKTILRIDKVN